MSPETKAAQGQRSSAAEGLTETNVRSNGMALNQPITGKAGEQ